MFVVALMELATSIEAEAAALAAHLGTTAYEERLNLTAGLPAIVLRTSDKKAATDLLAQVRSRGHGAVACDASKVLSSDALIPMRNFALEVDAITLPSRASDRLPYSDILALIRATHRTKTETRTEVKGKQISVGKALLTGGLMTTKSVKREEKSVTNEREQVLYLFRASGETAWILRERATGYAALGSAVAPSSFQNFMTTIARLRERAPQAAYDERLTAPGSSGGARAASVKSTSGSGVDSVSVSSAGGVDLMAHLLALWFARGGRR